MGDKTANMHFPDSSCFIFTAVDSRNAQLAESLFHGIHSELNEWSSCFVKHDSTDRDSLPVSEQIIIFYFHKLHKQVSNILRSLNQNGAKNNESNNAVQNTYLLGVVVVVKIIDSKLYLFHWSVKEWYDNFAISFI